MDHSISIILPNQPTYYSTQRVMEKNQWDYPIYNSSGDYALRIAEQRISDGTLIIISSGLTFEYLKNKLFVPVIELPFSGLEVAGSIKSALTLSNRIVHIGTEKYFHLIRESLELLDADPTAVDFCELKLGEDIEKTTLTMLAKGYEVIIGSHHIVSLARKYKKTGIEIDVSESTIENVLITAKMLADKMIAEQRGHEFEDALFSAVSESIFVTYSNGIVYSANESAKRLIPGDIYGHTVDSLLEENNIIDVEKADINHLDPVCTYIPVTIKKHPISLDNGDSANIFSIQTLPNMDKSKYRTRHDLFIRGLYASRTFNDIKGSSLAISKAKDQAFTYAKYDSPVLISGETGTGKELFAQSIHNSSKRKLSPFVAVNCAALPESLIESELFGYVKGAFTGANAKGKTGFFELADSGTIFLDEISELPIAIQSKLLRVIQEGEIIRVGSDTITHVDVRIICSSNKNLLSLVEAGLFKADLFYRLNVLEVLLPSLRNRREDIKPLSYAFLREFNTRHDKNTKDFEPEIFDTLKALPLLGNVRELSNIIERMVIMSSSDILTDTLLKEIINTSASSSSTAYNSTYSPHKSDNASGNLKHLQRDAIINALEKNGGNKAATANELGISPTTLWRRLKQYEI